MKTFQKLFWIAFGIYAIILIGYGVFKLPIKNNNSSDVEARKDVDIKSEKRGIINPREETSMVSKDQNINDDVSSEIAGLNEEQISIALSKVADENNKRCPIMVDKETRLDNMAALFGRVVQYNYTFVNSKRSEINIKELEKQMIPEIKNNVRTNPGLKEFRQLKVTFVYDYKDKFGNHIFNFSILPNEYNR